MGRVIDGYKELARLINEVPEAKELIAGWDRVVQFIVEGEGDFYIETKGGEASFHLGKHESPNVTLEGPEEVFYKMVTRELDATKAYFKRQYTIKGSMGDAMKFGRIGAAVAKTHKIT